MKRSSHGMGVATRLIIGGSGLLLFCFAYRRIRRSVNSKNGVGDIGVEGREKDKEILNQDKLVVPVEVVSDKLANRWAVASPIFISHYLAVIYFLYSEDMGGISSSEGECFIMCDGPLNQISLVSKQTEDISSFFLNYMKNKPLLQSVLSNDAAVLPLEVAGFSCSSGCFTHIIMNSVEEMAVVLGCNGPYIISLVLTHYSPLIGENEQNVKKRTNNNNNKRKFAPIDAQMLLDACRPVSLVDELRFPGTPAGVREGQLRLTCHHGDYTVVLSVPTTVTVRRCGIEPHKGNNNNNKKNNEVICILESDFLPGEGKLLLQAATIEAMVKGVGIDVLFPSTSPHSLRVSSILQILSVEEIAGPQRGRVSTTEDSLNIVFYHNTLGVSFSVNSNGGLVREPVLTDDLLVLYYPLGENIFEGNNYNKNKNNESVNDFLPCVTIRRITRVPPTWEKFLATEDELKHNVLFHFTDWAHERIPCSIADINGWKCVQLHEEKEGYSCRSYVIPWSNDILLVRWETKTTEWELYFPLLQKFIDTLHLTEKN